MSWADKVHRERAKEDRRNREIIQDGQVFYDVCVLGMWRALRKRGLNFEETEHIIDESMREMFDIYKTPGDYHEMCIGETGIEVVMEE